MTFALKMSNVLPRFEKLNPTQNQGSRALFFFRLLCFAVSQLQDIFNLKKYFSSMTYSFPKLPDDLYTEIPNFEFEFDALERLKKPLTLSSTRRRRSKQQQQQTSEKDMCDSRPDAVESQPIGQTGGIVAYSDDELKEFKESMVAKNTKKSTFVPYAG